MTTIYLAARWDLACTRAAISREVPLGVFRRNHNLNRWSVSRPRGYRNGSGRLHSSGDREPPPLYTVRSRCLRSCGSGYRCTRGLFGFVWKLHRNKYYVVFIYRTISRDLGELCRVCLWPICSCRRVYLVDRDFAGKTERLDPKRVLRASAESLFYLIIFFSV